MVTVTDPFDQRWNGLECDGTEFRPRNCPRPFQGFTVTNSAVYYAEKVKSSQVFL